MHPCASSFAFKAGGMFSPAGESLRSSVFRLVNFSKPSEIVKSQKRNNSLCGMMVQANYKIMKEKRTILLLGRDSSLRQDWQLSVWRFTKPPIPSGIAMYQKRNNSLCGMMVHAKYENERRITVFLLSGSFSSSSQ